MDSKRAREIVASPVMVNVTHNNSPVYMEKINEISRTCTIHYLSRPNQREDVPLSSLTEH